ncbi:MAG: hypothetical protein JSR97_03465 [Verrucomicrobia bacterium]|nr:hypothetical protein [Verrucomicrobiota bacterium]
MTISPLSRPSSQIDLHAALLPANESLQQEAAGMPTSFGAPAATDDGASEAAVKERAAIINAQEVARIRSQMTGNSVPMEDGSSEKGDPLASANKVAPWTFGASALWFLTLGYYQGGRGVAPAASDSIVEDAAVPEDGADKKDVESASDSGAGEAAVISDVSNKAVDEPAT